MFNANQFLVNNARANKTTVKVHGHKMALEGTPDTFARSDVAALAADQDAGKGVIVTSPKYDLETGRPAEQGHAGDQVTVRYNLAPQTAAKFVLGEPAAKAVGTRKARKASQAPVETNGVQS